ncbi:hypothetical protein [Coralliovum pocilloporae]|uniref:hypothetical protein n=1 Tax=Coralliovum pocilloporae TaxID=3066369 RepID=UPI003307580F
MTLAETIISGVEIYGIIGLVIAGLFLFVGLDRVDPAAKDAYAFRPLLVPGIVVLWPLVLWRWAQLEKVRAKGCGSDHCQTSEASTSSSDLKSGG